MLHVPHVRMKLHTIMSKSFEMVVQLVNIGIKTSSNAHPTNTERISLSYNIPRQLKQLTFHPDTKTNVYL